MNRKALYLATGAIIINWGLVESAIGQTCDLLIQLGGHRKYPEPPRNLSDSFEFIKLCFRDDARFAGMTETCSEIRSMTKELVPHRDFIVHGALTNFDREKRVFTFTKLKSNNVEFEQWSTNLSVEQLLEISDAAIKTCQGWLAVVEALHQIRDGA